MNELTTSFSNRIASLYKNLTSDRRSIQLELVAYANTNREIGLLLKSWCGKEQITFAFYESNKTAMPFTFEDAKKFISIATAMPDKAKCIEDVRRVIQTEFISITERATQQHATALSPLVEFVHLIQSAKVRLKRWVDDEPVEDWTDDRKDTLRAELRWAVELNERLQ
jgi:hypothetical protein